jgi:molybdopterin-guanine dinucleotide biosynthesis protein MobB
VKHIRESNFTIDTPGKDTWRYAKAGATTVVGISTEEVATIEKTKHADFSLKKILQKCRGSDLVFLEGFKELVAKNDKIYKIIVVNSVEEAVEDLRTFQPVIAMTGPVHPKQDKRGIPYVDVRNEADRLVDLIEKTVGKKAAV